MHGLDAARHDGGCGGRVGHRHHRQHGGRRALEKALVGDVQAGKPLRGDAVGTAVGRATGVGTAVGRATGVGTLYDAPRDGEGPRQGRLLVVELGGAVTDAAGIDEHDAPAGTHEVGQDALGVDEPREPRLHAVEDLALRQPLPLRASPRLGTDEGGGPGTHVLGGEHLATPEELDLTEVPHRTLVPGVELGETVDLVAPQVDPHRQLGGRRVHVDDPAPHGELAPVLDLVLAPVAESDEPGYELVQLETIAACHVHGNSGLLEGAQALQQGAHRGHDHRRGAVGVLDAPQQPQAPPHGRHLGADAFEGQGVPRREQRHGVVPEEGAEVVAEALARRPRWASPPTGAGARPTRTSPPPRRRPRRRAPPARRCAPPWRRPWRARYGAGRGASEGSPPQVNGRR